jgi:hypothetical protein
MTADIRRPTWESWLWIATLGFLILCRLPAFVAPAGSDQSLYMYVGDRILEGGAPYVDAWDQKPPGIHLAYAFLRSFWPGTSAVALLDLLTALGTAALLIVLGRRLAGPRAGFVAATVFLLFGDPAISRLDGLYVRGQCETVIGLAITAALVSVWRSAPTSRLILLAGVFLAIAFWVKYNAVLYALPILAATIAGRSGSVLSAETRSRLLRSAGLLVVAAIGLSIPVLIYLWSHGAVLHWWLATIDFNLRYSGESYRGGLLGGIGYALLMPTYRVRMDFLWFLGAVGAVLVLTARDPRTRRTSTPLLLWLVAAIGSILMNGARDLPQYFVQAKPALALLFAVGLATLATRARTILALTSVLMVVGLWRVGTDAPGWLGLRWGGLPQAIDNITLDLDYARGRIDRQAYLARFVGQQKYDAAESEALAALIRSTTDPHEPVLVFGFSPAVYLDSDRRSASTFFWSRPVILEFEGQRSGYGSRGLVLTLERERPSIVALQKKDWGPTEPTSFEFVQRTERLKTWLENGYVRERETPFYSIWRRKP